MPSKYVRRLKKRAKSFYPPFKTNLRRYAKIISANNLTIDDFSKNALLYVLPNVNGAFGTASIQLKNGRKASKIKADCKNTKFRSLLEKIVLGKFPILTVVSFSLWSRTRCSRECLFDQWSKFLLVKLTTRRKCCNLRRRNKQPFFIASACKLSIF